MVGVAVFVGEDSLAGCVFVNEDVVGFGVGGFLEGMRGFGVVAEFEIVESGDDGVL